MRVRVVKGRRRLVMGERVRLVMGEWRESEGVGEWGTCMRVGVVRDVEVEVGRVGVVTGSRRV